MDLNKKPILIASVAVISIISVLILYKVIVFISKGSGAGIANNSISFASPADEDLALKNSEEIISKNQDPAKVESAYWRVAAIYDKRNDLIKARDTYKKIIEKFPASNNIIKAQEALSDLNIKILFSDILVPGAILYEVKRGDNLVKIAKKFNTTVNLISRSNNLKSDALRSGKKLKITTLKFSIVVDKSQNILTLKADGNVFKVYRVSTGKNSSTPVGTFKIITKIIDPPWYQPSGKVIPAGDPKNSLGSRWLGISKPSYGIHGTIDPDSIGKSVTEGCVRLKNSDVEELYTIVPEGTEVVIVD